MKAKEDGVVINCDNQAKTIENTTIDKTEIAELRTKMLSLEKGFEELSKENQILKYGLSKSLVRFFLK